MSRRGGSTGPAWRAALRIARRDAWRAKGRSLLVIVLIGLPVLVLSMVDVGWRTYELSAQQKLNRAVGTADLAVMSAGAGAPVQQRPMGWLDPRGYMAGNATGSLPDPTEEELAKALPPDSRIIVRKPMLWISWLIEATDMRFPRPK